MNANPLTLATVVVVPLAVAGTAVPAQQARPAAAPPRTAAAAVGHWLYDDRGEIVGSIKSVSADGRTATIVLGIYKLDVVRVVEVPADALSIVDGRATLRAGTMAALGARSSG